MFDPNDARKASLNRRLLIERQRTIRCVARSMSAVIIFMVVLLGAGAMFFGYIGNMPMAHILKDMFAIALPAVSSVLVAAVALRKL